MQKHEKELLDELLIEEYRSFVEDPYAYEFDRETARDELGNDGFLDDESFENVCERFENRYLDMSTRDASPTFSKHGLERARLLGEDLYVDDRIHAEIMRVLGTEEETRRDEVVEQVDAEEPAVSQNLWILERKNLVETSVMSGGNYVTVSLTEQGRSEIRDD